MLSIARGITLQAGQPVLHFSTTKQGAHDLRFVQLDHLPLRKQSAETTKTVQASSQQQHARGVAIKAVNEMQVLLHPEHPADHGVLQSRTTPWLTEQPTRLLDHHHPVVSIENRGWIKAEAGHRNA